MKEERHVPQQLPRFGVALRGTADTALGFQRPVEWKRCGGSGVRFRCMGSSAIAASSRQVPGISAAWAALLRDARRARPGGGEIGYDRLCESLLGRNLRGCSGALPEYCWPN